MKNRFPLFVLVAPLLVACGNPAPSSSHATGLSSSQTPSSNSQSSSSASSSSAPSYTDKEVNVFYVKSELNFKTKLRFYDTTGDIPYIPIDDYYSLLLKGRSTDPNRSKLTVTANGDAYTVASPGGNATFNVATETMTTDNLPFFVSTKTYANDYNALLGTDGMPWMKVGEVKASGDPQKTVIDFSKYHIDLKGEGNRLYLPLITAQDLFSDSDLINSFYNRKDIYVYVGGVESIEPFGLDCYEPCLKTDIGKNYASYLYNEMCFDYDFLLGRPTRSSLEKYYDLSQGLDKALESRPYGKLAKQYLTDGTALGYATGLFMMGKICADGGHTSINPFASLGFDPETKTQTPPSWYQSLFPSVVTNIMQIEQGNYDEVKNACAGYNHHDEIRTNRHDVLNLTSDPTNNLRGEETYKKEKSTAFIFIDDYMGEYFNREDWKTYYEGQGELPFGPTKGGSVTSIYKGLLKAQADPEIKNVVIDLSSNMGGSVDEMMYVISLITGDSTMSIENRITKQTLTASFLIDRNLDKKFDEQDAAFNPLQGKNVAVLMSQNGFSCGGISPIYLHDRGVFTMGDISGGGCCSILYQHTGVGLKTVRSSTDAVLAKNGKKIDEAREDSCDHKFEIKAVTQESKTTYDFSAFFNVDEIERILTERNANN